jgi:hypothetical protein
MTVTVTAIESRDDVMERAKARTLISPRFYTTDYKAMDRLDMSPVRKEWDEMLAEYEGDNNHDHFQRDASFARTRSASCRPSCSRSSWTSWSARSPASTPAACSTTRSGRTSTTPTSSS